MKVFQLQHGLVSFLVATERFKTDAAQEERERRLNQRARDQQRIEVKRYIQHDITLLSFYW